MTASLMDWLSLLLRWAHVMAGIGWIGTSFYFIWLDRSLRKRAGQDPRLAGELDGPWWRLLQGRQVPGRPETVPEELHWFKYEAYLTWLTGFLLLAVIYYWGAESFLVGPTAIALTPAMAIAVSIASLAAGWLAYDLLCRSPIGANTALLAVSVFLLIALAAFGYAQVFPGRAAFLHAGAFIGTIMAANVFGVIIPNQKKTVAALMDGKAPDAKYGAQAKQRSLHNNYLTLPVLFMMISNHYPLTYGHRWNWLVAIGVVVAGAMVRHFFNAQDAGKLTFSAKLAVPGAVAVIVALALLTSWRPAPEAGDKVAYADIHTIVRARCSSCHSAHPTDEDFEQAPGGVMLDAPEELRRYASRIEAQAVLTHAMPLGNKTGMTDDERETLGAWIAQGAPID